MKKVFLTGGMVVFFFTSAVPCAVAQQKVSDGKTLFEKVCSACHGISRAESKKKSPEEWSSTVARMRQNGAKFTDSEGKLISDYLAKTYPKK